MFQGWVGIFIMMGRGSKQHYETGESYREMLRDRAEGCCILARISAICLMIFLWWLGSLTFSFFFCRLFMATFAYQLSTESPVSMAPGDSWWQVEGEKRCQCALVETVELSSLSKLIQNQWIGLVKSCKIYRKPSVFTIKYGGFRGFRFQFSRRPIQWQKPDSTVFLLEIFGGLVQ